MGYEKNMSFLVIPKSPKKKLKKSQEKSDQAPKTIKTWVSR